MRRKVLIGYDGRPEAEDALGLGRELARALDASALVTTVVRHPRHGVEEADYERAVAEFCDPIFSTARERLEGVEVSERAVVNNSRPAGFYEVADWEKPAVIAIGSTHKGPAGRVLLGSLGQSLLSGCPCGVAVAPRGYGGGEHRVERIGLAVDASSEARRALAAAGVLAREVVRPLEMITVMEPPHYALGGLLSPLSPDQYREFKEAEARRVLDEAAALVPDQVSVEPRLLHGEPAEALAEAGEDLDLLIVGSRGYGPAKGAMLGSVSARLMASAPCPVLVLARGGGSRPLEE